MIISKCPIRISLVGGSSDLESSLLQHKKGATISFPVDIFTYSVMHKDCIGNNSHNNKYVINYSLREMVDDVENVQNILIKSVLEEFKIPPQNISLYSDIFSVGSGLASSSSHVISLLNSVLHSKGKKPSNYDLSTIAMKIERKFNSLVGFQDPYGCGMGKLKRMDFSLEHLPKISYLPSMIFDSFDMYLVYTGISRDSNSVLKTINHSNTKLLLDLVDEMQECVERCQREKFVELISTGWEIKKETSKKITENKKIREMDRIFENDDDILCHKLCGAGNGGFFIIFTEANKNINNNNNEFDYVKIKINENGAEVFEL
tara:strand:+ start:461 stop:1414 length:954 start_codon:yes stop_codon:yes gene_type:complete